MSLTTQISTALTRIGTEFKTVYALTGTLSGLSTTDKSSLVAAINEIRGLAVTSPIDDTSTTSTTKAWSASKITGAIAQAKNDIIGGASGAWDTLLEIQNTVTGDESNITALLIAVGYRLRFDAAQSLTGPQQTQGQANLGVYSTAQIGDPTTDLAAVFTAALS